MIGKMRIKQRLSPRPLNFQRLLSPQSVLTESTEGAIYCHFMCSVTKHTVKNTDFWGQGYIARVFRQVGFVAEEPMYQIMSIIEFFTQAVNGRF